VEGFFLPKNPDCRKLPEMKPKISLCVIAGNVEKQIGRFLDAFAPVADEVIVVRAIGSQEPDRTLEIAQSRGCRVSSYYNKRHDWPHVEDFAAARNNTRNSGHAEQQSRNGIATWDFCKV